MAAGTGQGGVPPDLVLMAQVKEPYGLKGWVKLYSFSEGESGLAGFDEWWVDYGTEARPDWRAVVPEERGDHSGTLIAKLPGVSDRDQAFALKGHRIAVPRSLFPASSAEDGYYWSDLIGLDVKNRQGELLGQVDGLLDLGPHEVLRIKGEEGEILIPFVAQYVDRVDTEAKVITVDWGKDY